jgi:hypothetical protein
MGERASRTDNSVRPNLMSGRTELSVLHESQTLTAAHSPLLPLWLHGSRRTSMAVAFACAASQPRHWTWS